MRQEKCVPTDLFLDFDADPGLQPCDKCHRIKLCQWFGAVLLCPECLTPAVETMGLDALGKSAERLATVWGQNTAMQKALSDLHQFLCGYGERTQAKATGIEELLGRVRGGG